MALPVSVTDLFCEKNSNSKFSEIFPKSKKKFSKTIVENRINMKNVKHPSKARIELNKYLIKFSLKSDAAAKKIGVGIDTFSDWVRGHSQPKDKEKVFKVFGIPAEWWDDKHEKNKVENLGIRFLKLYMKDHNIGVNKLCDIINSTYGTIMKWFNQNKPNNLMRERISDILKINFNMWDQEVTDKEWEEIIKNENNIPWKKNNKTILRKKENIVFTKVEDKNIVIDKDKYVQEAIKDNEELDNKFHDRVSIDGFLTIHKFIGEFDKRCYECDIDGICKHEDCHEFMFNLTGIDCAKKNQEFDSHIYFKIKKYFDDCSKENIEEGDDIYSKSNERKVKIIEILKVDSGVFKDQVILRTEDNVDYLDDLNKYKIRRKMR